MLSKASFRSHPIHPILVGFPIAFFVASVLSGLYAVLSGRVLFFRFSDYLAIAGILFGFMAAIPGFIDYLHTVPPASSGKKRAARHGLTNAAVLILFITSVLLEKSAAVSPWVTFLLRAVSLIPLTIAGWMGGTLVYRNQIGVDIRYAGAGKWQEADISYASDRVDVAAVSDLEVDQMRLLHLNGKRIVLARTEAGFTAFDDRCTHRGGSLAAGSLICGTVQCPWHGSQFDAATGAVKAGPAKERINCYKVEELGGRLILILR